MKGGHRNMRQQGFTLVEVLIAVVIVGILTAIALPAYQEQLRKSRRAEGKAALLKTIQLQERFYTANGTYADNAQLPTLYAVAGPVRSGEDPMDANGWYTITVTNDATCAPLNTCVTLTATPRFTDENCGVLTLNSRGVQTESGSRDVAYCWRG